jgi:glycosyltransferase involved in cell wall biosynthesis
LSETTFAVVTTTINVPTLLEAYVDDALRSNRRLAEVIVVGDRKTDPAAAHYCASLQESRQVRVRYFAVEEQERYLGRFSDFAEFLPWNCIQRRNVGLLAAYESGADVVVTIDDDNFLESEDYLGSHAHVGRVQSVSAVSTESGWWNVCSMLEEERGIPFYHRGHPLEQRWRGDLERESWSPAKARIVVNAGLWLDDPDVDALTRLYFPVRAVGPAADYRPRAACNIGTWAPFNSQNTALARDVVPAYLLFPYIGRYDDIWASYVVRRIADHLGDLVTYGEPLVRQLRNPHDYFRDFDAERFGLESNATFLDALARCRLTCTDYREGFAQLAAQFGEAIGAACEEAGRSVDEFANVCRGFELWTGIFNVLG